MLNTLRAADSPCAIAGGPTYRHPLARLVARRPAGHPTVPQTGRPVCECAQRAEAAAVRTESCLPAIPDRWQPQAIALGHPADADA